MSSGSTKTKERGGFVIRIFEPLTAAFESKLTSCANVSKVPWNRAARAA
jgi:hypothetical protein